MIVDKANWQVWPESGEEKQHSLHRSNALHTGADNQATIV
jgi:hypothetical protein